MTACGFVVLNGQTGKVVGRNIQVAETFMSRLVGLLGKTTLKPGEGLLIRPCSGVHTLGMRFPIDVIALSKSNHVVRTWSNVKPWRACGIAFATKSVLELAAGEINAAGIRIGDQLYCQSAEDVAD